MAEVSYGTDILGEKQIWKKIISDGLIKLVQRNLIIGERDVYCEFARSRIGCFEYSVTFQIKRTEFRLKSSVSPLKKLDRSNTKLFMGKDQIDVSPDVMTDIRAELERQFELEKQFESGKDKVSITAKYKNFLAKFK